MSQAIIWAKGDQDVGRYSTALGHNELSGIVFFMCLLSLPYTA